MTSRNKGFTLVELLAVIAIIGVLAGLIFPTIGAVQNKARKGKTQSMIQSLSIALKMYQNDFGLLPLTTDSHWSPSPTSSAHLLYLALGQRHTGTSAGNVGPYVEFKTKDLNSSNEVTDPFGNPYYYYPDDDNGVAGDAPFHNVFSFDIYSLGPDGSTGSGSGAGNQTDDINNWK